MRKYAWIIICALILQFVPTAFQSDTVLAAETNFVLTYETMEDGYNLTWNAYPDAVDYGLKLVYKGMITDFFGMPATYFPVSEQDISDLFGMYYEDYATDPDNDNTGFMVNAYNEDYQVIATSNLLSLNQLRGLDPPVFPEPTPIVPATVSASPLTYNGKLQTPKVIIKDSEGNIWDKSTYTVSKVKNVGLQTFTVSFDSPYAGIKLTGTVMVNPKATTVSKVTAKSKKLVIKWKKQGTQVKGYQIQYATNNKFTKNVKLVSVKSSKKTSYTIKKLKAKTKYFVRIRTYKGSCYSKWSKTTKIKTK